jgi:hypothetical protein
VVSFAALPLYLRGRAPVPIGWKVRWIPEPVWTPWSRAKSLAPAGNRILAVQPITRRYTDGAVQAPNE